MVVDDDIELLEEIKEILTSGKYDIEITSDSAVAHKKACELQPDLIITDLKMRAKSGFQLVDELHGSCQTKSIPIIALTGFFAEDEYIPIMKMHGIKHTVSKPFHIGDFLAKIESVLRETKNGSVLITT